MWNLKNIPAQVGRIAIITGANSGIGFETAFELAGKEMIIIMACRDLQAAEIAKNSILKAFPRATIHVKHLDLSSLKSVRYFAADFLANFDRLDLLINNAGIMMSPYKKTEDGFENQLATNFLGHFALTGLLLSKLTQTPNSRVITLSSLSYKWAELDFEDFQFETKYDKKKAYGQSKRACLVFAYELDRRLKKSSNQNTISLAAHPGLSKTNLDRYFPALIRPLGGLFLQSQKKGALPILFAGLSKEMTGGEYIGPDGFQEMRGNPTRVDSDFESKDQQIADKLWITSEKLTGVSYKF